MSPDISTSSHLQGIDIYKKWARSLLETTWLFFRPLKVYYLSYINKYKLVSVFLSQQTDFFLDSTRLIVLQRGSLVQNLWSLPNIWENMPFLCKLYIHLAVFLYIKWQVVQMDTAFGTEKVWNKVRLIIHTRQINHQEKLYIT